MPARQNLENLPVPIALYQQMIQDLFGLQRRMNEIEPNQGGEDHTAAETLTQRQVQPHDQAQQDPIPDEEEKEEVVLPEEEDHLSSDSESLRVND